MLPGSPGLFDCSQKQTGSIITSIEKPYTLKVGVLLVNYRQWSLTEKCVTTLLASEDAEITVALVDNATPGTIPEWVAADHRIHFHRAGHNEGLTAGNNRAFDIVRKAGVDYVFILNNDTEVAPDTAALLAEYLRTHPETGIASPVICYASHPELVWSAGGDFSRRRMSLRQKYGTLDDLPDNPVQMEQVTGCAMMMRACDYASAGMQDPDLFVYYEDTDLCFRIKSMGKNIVLVPAARVLHHVSVSVGGVLSPFAIYFTHRNRYIIASRFLSVGELVPFRAYYLLVTVFKTFFYPLTGNGKLVFWMWLGFVHGVWKRSKARPKGLFKGVSS